jgi:hypothetical protein
LAKTGPEEGGESAGFEGESQAAPVAAASVSEPVPAAGGDDDIPF